MEELKITYTPWIKNAKRGNTLYSCRVYEKGEKPFDLPLKTDDLATAENWCRLRRAEVEMFNGYVRMGEQVPEEVSNKVIRQANRNLQKAAQLTWEGAVEKYIAYCNSTGLRHTTQDDYMKRLQAMLRPLNWWYNPIPKITPDVVKQIVRSYDHKEPQTRRGYGNCLKQFLTFWSKEVKSYDPAVFDAIPTVKLDKKEHAIWTMDEMQAIVRHAPDVHTALYWATLVETGARNTELSLCTWDDLKDGCIRLKAEYCKGRRTRVLPLTPELYGKILELKEDDGRIFKIPTTNTQRNSNLKHACDRAGVKRGTLHQFRHSAAVFYFRKGLDIKDVQTLLGHADANTTLSIYIEATSHEELGRKMREALNLDQ